jgi:hypothetical protein
LKTTHLIDSHPTEREMAYCPKCRYEYENDIEYCPDCEVDLIAELPPEIPPEYQDAEWVELYSFPGVLYARMAIELLNREGIASYTQSYFGTAGLGPSAGGEYIGGAAAVFVLEPDLERGRDVIESMVDELPGVGDSDIDEDE